MPKDQGLTEWDIVDDHIPTAREKGVLQVLGIEAPITISGARDTPEEALADLLQALEDLGLITDSTSAS